MNWYRSPCFRFDEICYSIPSHSLPSYFRKIMGQVKIEGVSESQLNNTTTPYNYTTGVTVTIPLPHI